MTQLAFVFPGQGSQQPGMGRALFDADPVARAAFAEMDAALDMSVSRLCFEGSADELARTENTQPAILACSIAAWRCLDARGVTPAYVAGHSLGEYSALVAAGVLSAGDAIRTVRRRGRYMQDAVPKGVGAMAAILGIEPYLVEEACHAATGPGEIVAPANFNSPGQIVVAGHRPAVERAIEEASRRGARRAVLLPVSAPFHCELMAPAAARLADDLRALAFSDFRVPLIANVTGREVSEPIVERELLRAQVVAPVRWQQSVERLVELGVDTFVEVGPGTVLTGLIKRIARGARLLNVAGPEDLDRVVAELAT